MNNRFWLIFSTEIFWWILILIFCLIAILPVVNTIHPAHVKLIAIFSLLFIVLFRFLLFTNQIVYLKPTAVKIILVLLIPVCFYYVISLIQDYLVHFDDYDLSGFLNRENLNASGMDMNSAYQFFKKEFVLFSVGNLILMLLLELRLILQLLQRLRKIK